MILQLLLLLLLMIMITIIVVTIILIQRQDETAPVQTKDGAVWRRPRGAAVGPALRARGVPE